jgi:hypothetical protein
MKRLLLLKIVFMLLVGTCSALDKVETMAQAIARTEGFFVQGTIPNRYHNPGDIRSRLRHAYPGQIGLKRGYVVFRSDTFGWSALRAQIQRVIDGSSTKYTTDMTFRQIGRKYAVDSRWVKSVCKIMGIDPGMTFAKYFDLPP